MHQLDMLVRGQGKFLSENLSAQRKKAAFHTGMTGLDKNQIQKAISTNSAADIQSTQKLNKKINFLKDRSAKFGFTFAESDTKDSKVASDKANALVQNSLSDSKHESYQAVGTVSPLNLDKGNEYSGKMGLESKINLDKSGQELSTKQSSIDTGKLCFENQASNLNDADENREAKAYPVEVKRCVNPLAQFLMNNKLSRISSVEEEFGEDAEEELDMSF